MVFGMWIDETCGNCAKSEGAGGGGYDRFCTLEKKDREVGRDGSPCRHYGDFDPSDEAIAGLAHLRDLRAEAGRSYPASLGAGINVR